MDRAERWLYLQRGRLLDARQDRPEGLEDRAEDGLAHLLDGLDALVAAGAVGAEAAAAFRTALDEEPDAYAGPDPRAEALLAGMLDRLPADADGDEEPLERFDGAVHLLSAAGLVHAGEWHARVDGRYGWGATDEELALEPQGGTQIDLVSVHAGPPEWRDGYRLVLLVRFADAVTVRLEKDPAVADTRDWPEWQLRDGAGTAYRPQGGSTDDAEETASFAEGPPPGAEWVELSRPDRPAVVFKVAL